MLVYDFSVKSTPAAPVIWYAIYQTLGQSIIVCRGEMDPTGLKDFSGSKPSLAVCHRLTILKKMSSIHSRNKWQI